MSTGAPYESLTPDCILDACASIGLRGDGRLLALNSYENRVYQVWMEEGAPLVFKFYRPHRWTDEQIREEHAFAVELAEREIPVVAPIAGVGGATLHEFANFRFAAYPKQGGRAPELEDPTILERIGRFIGRIHALGAVAPFSHRPTLNIETFAEEPLDYLTQSGFIPADLLSPWKSVMQMALAGAVRCYERAGAFRTLRLHGDCHLGNLLWSESGAHFVDLDDSRMGPALQDLWMLLSGDAQAMGVQLGHLLAGYEDFADFDVRELHLLEALRTLRLIHYCAWLARRWDDPAFPAAFPWFNTPRYWQDRILEMREQVALMDDAPIRIAGPGLR
jgi:Ser/Thr protein kinase RdoA (MazF antagonist)